VKSQEGGALIEPDPVDPPGEILRAIYRGAAPPEPPSTPLSVSSLLMNALDEPRLGFELEREMATSDRVFMVVSFIQWRGWQRLKAAFQELVDLGVPIRLLTTTYIGATDFPSTPRLYKHRFFLKSLRPVYIPNSDATRSNDSISTALACVSSQRSIAALQRAVIMRGTPPVRL
jgi:hypothetical protein